MKFNLTRNAIDEEVVKAWLEEFKTKLSDLCSVIKMFPCPTLKHRLCQNAITQLLVIRYALMQNALEEYVLLPQEYVLEKLRLSAFLDEDPRKQR
ncbi:nuclear pore complex protein Nup98-Nup96-like [Toxorhynchites rutilus septentrionalis]|uniref:nuclear pore complex protein Nup98-Nup96-like n=1 Tax=Toxorhynchites rutilus septentrionalis TaxID=329112 RepID=UPI0024797E9E|nr:nuclear pore complex protein Nup98-Nup96-like [Toxorhynchites rutilus septentrionalis]XP_055630223.1 nuclear pore complex protein Nup98-Nup96-like [Toxorhynchites rutilus septentrionalis]XP_055630224.1 nuclear pore complex protein Nup98-Nup96-like [Toxorhynchites rutilus septentrionalis]XP_055635751.1 nuclear pore complex protein Nup98-Nup96-like [Toxorhynchites rutilus septentrionalis]XP_055635752.1 nuclear pore complex protein Nup98-Nup96-like [Toxorhynchites rutilus septentrionalis]